MFLFISCLLMSYISFSCQKPKIKKKVKKVDLPIGEFLVILSMIASTLALSILAIPALIATLSI